MIRRLTESDRASTLDLLGAAPEANVFLVGDIHNHGFDAPFQQVWGDFGPDGALRAVLLRYYRSLVFYGRGGFDFLGLAQLIESLDAGILSGEYDAVAPFERIGIYQPARRLLLCRLSEPTAGASPRGAPEPRRLGPDDAPRIHELRERIGEFTQTVGVEEVRAGLARGTDRSYGIELDGRLVSVATSTAENPFTAMIVGVCTHPAYRRRGLASRCMDRLCRDLLRDGRTPCLFYDNPEAGGIYRRLGFQEVGAYGILERA